jgi:hypothetical protein
MRDHEECSSHSKSFSTTNIFTHLHSKINMRGIEVPLEVIPVSMHESPLSTIIPMDLNKNRMRKRVLHGGISKLDLPPTYFPFSFPLGKFIP